MANALKPPVPGSTESEPPSASPQSEIAGDGDRRRFEVELEFVQCLANPAYLNFLAQNEYFDAPDFISYLKYLQYWTKPEYARFIVFPHALYFLSLVQEPTFREAMKRTDYSLMIHQQQGYHWQFEKTMKSHAEATNGAKTQQNGIAGAGVAGMNNKPGEENGGDGDGDVVMKTIGGANVLDER